MSRTADIVIDAVPRVIATGTLAAASGGLGAVVLGAGGVAYGTYLLLKRLQEDYQVGLHEFHRQANLEAKLRQQLARNEREKTDEALALIEQTRVSSTIQTDADFLRRRVEDLQQRHTGEEFTQGCRKLLAQIEQAPERFNAHLDAYRRLADAAGKQAFRNTLQDEIAALREEILSPLLDAPEVAETRAQLIAQLDALKEVAVRQRTVARQGLTVLRRRVYREIKTQAERRQARANAAEERRRLVGDILAKIQAIMRLPEMPAFTDRARELSARLSEALTREEGGLEEIQRIADQAGELFSACEQTLTGQVTTAYIEDELTEVMVSLGYQITRIPGEGDRHSLVSAVDDAHGIEFRVDGGHINSEMVALTPDAAVIDTETEEKVCGVVDQVIDELKKRQDGVRERFRTTLQPGDQLRVVETGEMEEITAADVELKKMRIDES